jgi:uracil-DNA glycosylase
MSPNEELHDIVRQLKTELEWAARTGIVVEDQRIEPSPTDVLEASQQNAVRPEQAQATTTSTPNRPGQESSRSVRPSLALIREDLGDCTRCKLHQGRKNIVFGVGNPNADLMFIGEGPGAEEDRSGEPFVGPAGQLLTKIIKAMGFNRDEVYIANIVKCRPPKNRDPERDEIEACIGFLRAQVAAVQPKVIVSLGRPASQTLLQTQTSISRLRGQWKSFEGISVMPTFHPSYLLRSPENKRPVWDDMQAVVKKLGGALPSRS